MLAAPVKEQKLQERFWSGTLKSTPVGPISVLVSTDGLTLVEFASAEEFARQLIVPVEKDAPAGEYLYMSLSQINDYLNGKLKKFTMPLDLRGYSEFSREVLMTASYIPFGQIRTYGSLAAAAGHPGAARAVGGAMSRNSIPLVIPCHRVVSSDGSLHGFSSPEGLKTKSFLLELEGHSIKNMKLTDGSWKHQN